MAVTGFGNGASAHAFTAGMLRGDKPQIGHQLFGGWESSHIANLRNYSSGHNKRYTSQGLVGFDKPGPTPFLNVDLYLLGDPLDSFAALICRLYVFLQSDLLGGVSKLDCRQPVIKAFGPVPLAAVLIPMAQQK